MRKQLCLVLAVLVSVSAYGQYKTVGGKVVPINSPDWTPIHDQIEVIGFSGTGLLCRTFTDGSVTAGSVGNRANPFGPTTHAIRNYKETFVLMNYPRAGSLNKGDIIRGPIRAMRVSSEVVHSGSGTETRIRSSGYDLYDYGVDYVPPQRQLAPEEAAAAKAQMNNANADKEAVKLKFDQEQADKGKDLYQYRMGLRYLNGNGVTNDLAKARVYFAKAAAQGNQEAAAELGKLSSQ